MAASHSWNIAFYCGRIFAQSLSDSEIKRNCVVIVFLSTQEEWDFLDWHFSNYGDHPSRKKPCEIPHRIKETIRDFMGWNSPHRKPQGRPGRTTWANKTHVWSYMGQCGVNFFTWWPIKDTIWDSIGWNYPRRNPRGRPCGTTWVNDTHTGSYMGQCGAKFFTWWPTKETTRDSIGWN